MILLVFKPAMVSLQHICPPQPWQWARKFPIEALFGEGVEIDTTLYDFGEDLIRIPCHRHPLCPHCGLRERHLNTAIVAIDGVCRDDGTPNARAGIGVYFGQRSNFNLSAVLNINNPTTQKADLHACLKALDQIRNIKDNHETSLSTVVIKADSEYIVQGMTEWIFKWKQNEFQSARGRPIINADLFCQIDDKVQDLKESGVEVLFWLVSRAHNQEADAWANKFGDV